MHDNSIAPSTSLSGRSLAVAPRLHFFDKQIFSTIRERLVDLDAQVSQFTARRDEYAPLSIGTEFWEHAVRQLVDISNSAKLIDSGNYLEHLHNGDIHFWGRQRIIAMILGYITLYCVDEPPNSDKESHTKIRRALNGVRFLNSLVAENSEQLRIPNYVANLSAKIYDFIRINDRYFLEYSRADASVQKYIFDPLIFARYASAMYRLGEFSAAYRVIDELFESKHYHTTDIEGTSGYHEIEFRSRLLQYRWYQSHLNRDAILDELPLYELLIGKATICIKSIESDSSDEQIISGYKAICWSIWIMGVISSMKIQQSARLKDHLAELLISYDRFFDRADELLNYKVYIHAAHAVVSFVRGNVEDAKGALVKAGKLLADGVPHPATAVSMQEKMIAYLNDMYWEKQYRWDAFVSYSNEDAEIVQKLAKELTAKELDLFVDYKYVGVGKPITPIIEEGLRNSRDVIMIVTDTYLSRKWTEIERIWFEVREKSLGDAVIVILLKDVHLENFKVRYPTLADRRVVEWRQGMSTKRVASVVAKALKQRATPEN